MMIDNGEFGYIYTQGGVYMTLLKKAIIFFMSFFIVWYLLMRTVISDNILKGYETVESFRFDWTINRVDNGVKALIKKHEGLILDWSKWDVAYVYVQFPNDAFIQDIIESNHFLDQGMNYYVFYDESDQVIQSDGWDLEKNRAKPVPKELIELLPNYKNDSGFVLIDGQAMVFITHEVFDNEGLLPPKGLFAFVYDVSDATLEKLSTAIHETVTIKTSRLNGNVEQESLHLDKTLEASYALLNYAYENVDQSIQFRVNLEHDIMRLGKKSTEDVISIFSVSLLLLVLGLLYIVGRVVSRISILKKELIRIYDDKHLNERIVLKSNDELGDLRDHINDLLDELQENQSQIRHYAAYDELTGVFNRRAGIEQLEVAIEVTSHDKKPLTIAFIDVNNLKYVNDIYGHNQGDTYLINICNGIKMVLGPDDMIARHGGDEFIVTFNGKTENSVNEIFKPVPNIINQVSKQHNIPYSMSISVGVFEYEEGLNVDEFIELADQKMYEEKLRHKKEKNQLSERK